MRSSVFTALLCLAGAFTTLPANAAAVGEHVTWDFTYGGSAHTNTGSSYGNVRTFTESGETATVNAWADTGPTPPANALEDAFLGRYSTGLGVCNRGEGSISYCDGSNPLHQADNVGQNDAVLFQFDQRMAFHEIVIDPFGRWDRDVTFWIGQTANPLDLTGVGINDLASVGFGGQYDDYNGIGSGAITIDLMGIEGNSLLFSALFPPNGLADRFKIRSLKASVVPIPAAAWLMGSGLMLLVGLRRRKHA